MKYVVYCIFPVGNRTVGIDIKGIEGEQVSVVQEGNLGAAVSMVQEWAVIPNIPRILAYQNVIDIFFHHTAVIPIRYGNFFDLEAEIRHHLYEHHERYSRLLGELDGCVEMGVRIIVPADNSNSRDTKTRPPDCSPKSNRVATGHGYLESRRKCYTPESSYPEKVQDITRRCLEIFGDISTKFKIEHPSLPGNLIASIYFLTPRQQVGFFQARFKLLVEEIHAQILLSGPWPPYNFVVPGRF